MAGDDKIFVDANVLLRAHDERDEGRRQRAMVWLQHCWRRRVGRVSEQVLHEFYQLMRQAAPDHPTHEVRSLVRAYRQWLPGATEGSVVEDAWVLQDRMGHGYWDALMLATAHGAGCRWLLSESLPHGMTIGSLTTVDPARQWPPETDTPVRATHA